MEQLDADVEVLVGKYVEQIDNTDLTQALLQLRARRRARTATARRQTDRLAGRTYADAAARASAESLASDAASATNATADVTNPTRANETAARDDRARRRSNRRR